ncbi:hypothetical protein M5K25_003017 [Dendrobium thyrsiflorum]|uniref:Uncharacterized protein n=1 Tax=Dendrobium thyrsiflorum TaxID=117978 RepID=A0ABD0VWG5_DENTH
MGLRFVRLVRERRRQSGFGNAKGGLGLGLASGEEGELLRFTRTTVGTSIPTDGDPVGKVRESTTTVVTPHTDYGDPVGRATESTSTVVTPHTNYGDPVGRVRKDKPTAVTPHTDYGDPVGKETESIPTVVAPHTNYGDPVGRVRDTIAPRKITLIAKSDFSTGGRTFPERNWISCTESNSSGDSFGSRVMACVAPTRNGGRTRSFSVSAGRDPVFPSEVTTYFSLSYIFLIQEEEEMCSVGTTTEEGEEETGKVKVLATVDLACGGLLSTASELCTACLIIPLVRSDRTINVLQQNLNCMLLLQLRFTLKTKYALNHWGDRHTTQMPPPQTANKQSEHQCIIPSYIATYGPILSHVLPGVPYPIKNSEARRDKTSGVRLPLVLDRIIGTAAGTEGTTVSIRRIVPTVCSVSTVGRNVLPGLRRSQERLQHRGCEQLWGDVAPAVKGPLAAGQAPAEPQKQPSPELLPQMQLNETEQEGQELQQKSPGSAGQSQSEKAWQKWKPGEKKEREARPEHPSSSKRKEEGKPEHESPLPERQLGELLADGAERPEPVEQQEL